MIQNIADKSLSFGMMILYVTFFVVPGRLWTTFLEALSYSFKLVNRTKAMICYHCGSKNYLSWQLRKPLYYQCEGCGCYVVVKL